MIHEHEQHEYFEGRCRWCCASRGIWAHLGCNEHAQPSRYLDLMAAGLKNDKRSEVQRLIDFIEEEENNSSQAD